MVKKMMVIVGGNSNGSVWATSPYKYHTEFDERELFRWVYAQMVVHDLRPVAYSTSTRDVQLLARYRKWFRHMQKHGREP